MACSDSVQYMRILLIYVIVEIIDHGFWSLNSSTEINVNNTSANSRGANTTCYKATSALARALIKP